jgi:hypothetical protein
MLLTPPLLPALCEALGAASVRIAADRKGRCVAAPPECVTPAMLAGLKRYKLEILRALKARPEHTLVTLHFCRRCGSDVVLGVTDYCAVCAVIAPRILMLEPGSPEEMSYLSALENAEQYAEQLSQTVPSRSNSPSGTVGTVGTLKQGLDVHIRAEEEKVKSA